MPAEARVEPAERAQLSHREREAEILALTSHQHGAVSHAQLRRLGVSSSSIARRLQRGTLHPLHRGVYAVGRPGLAERGHWMAAVLACGEGAVLSHASAAALHELRKSAASRVDVSVPRRCCLRRRGIHVHVSTTLAPQDVGTLHGIPCTSPARTLLDLAGIVHLGALERALDQAEILGVFDMSAMRDLLQRLPARRGVRNLRTVLGMSALGENVSRSELEARFLEICRAAALPVPAVNAWLVLAGEHVQIDFLWRAHRVAVEADGWRYHRTRRAFRSDRRRDQLLAAADFRHARFTWDEIFHERDHVTGIVRLLLSRSES